MPATAVHWFLYSPAGIAVLSLAATAAMALAVWVALVAIGAGITLAGSRLLARARRGAGHEPKAPAPPGAR